MIVENDKKKLAEVNRLGSMTKYPPLTFNSSYMQRVGLFKRVVDQGQSFVWGEFLD